MDGFHFDALTRTLTTAGSRRRALTGLLFGSLGLLGDWAEETAAKNCKKIKNKQKRKKCLAKARTPTPTCTRSCAGKTCGDDGCGCSCGDCFLGSCQGGICVCPTGEEVCKGACRAACAEPEKRNTETCDCCTRHGFLCGLSSQCCSRICGAQGCEGRNGLEACTWDGQCASGVCEAGTCTCKGDVCKGVCKVPCTPPRSTRNPDTCACCTTTGHECSDGSCNCCCSGTCDGPVGERPCSGLLDGTPCSFNAQCASGTCAPNCSEDNICTIATFCQPT